MKFRIQRYSPGRRKWVDWNEFFDDKEKAQERVVTLKYKYRVHKHNFRVVKILNEEEKKEVRKNRKTAKKKKAFAKNNKQ